LKKKISKKINFIRRLGNKLNKHSKMTLYNAIIIPNFDYCSSILFLANEGEFNSLQKLQNRIMRTILKCRMDTPIRDMLQSLNLLSAKKKGNIQHHDAALQNGERTASKLPLP
jgi:hypothetical protein